MLRAIRKYWVGSLLVATSFAYYFPALASFDVLVSRGGDLQEFFYPLVFFAKEQILQGTFPLWQNIFLSGAPLVADPQAPIFYLPNIIFLVLPIDYAFIMSFVLHTFLAGLFMYWYAKHGFGVYTAGSLLAAIIYMATPRLAAYLDAGHVGLIYASAWLPLIGLSIQKLLHRPQLSYCFLMSLSLAAVFYTHLVTFALVLPFAALAFLAQWLLLGKKLKSLNLFFLAIVLAFGLSAVALLPQLAQMNQTTRVLALNNKEVFPIWQVSEFIQMVIWPYSGEIQTVDTEKVIYLGVVPLVLALFGFWKLTNKYKLLILSLLLPALLLALNNRSPVLTILDKIDWYYFLRVTTRVWFVPILAVSLLAGWSTRYFSRNRILLWSIFLLTVIDLFVFANLKIYNSKQNISDVPPALYQFLDADKERFRVTCLTHCLSQKEIAKIGKELVDGYNTLQLRNYYEHSIQLYDVWFFNRYTLVIPPFEIFQTRQIYPNGWRLGLINTKYIVSPYPLDNNAIRHLTRVAQFGRYLLYKNNDFLPRSYFAQDGHFIKDAKIISYSPNEIIIDTANAASDLLVLAEVATPGWQALANGTTKKPIRSDFEIFRTVKIDPSVKFVSFVYRPAEFFQGLAATLLTLFIMAQVIKYTKGKWQ